MNIVHLFRYLWRKKWHIILPTVIAVSVTWYFYRNQGRTYTSTAELSTGYFEVNPLSNNANVNNTVLFNNVIQTLKSKQVLDQVSYELLLHDLNSNDPFQKLADPAAGDRLLQKYPGGKTGFLSALNNKADSFQVLDMSKNNDKIIREAADLYGYSSDNMLNNIVDVSRIEGSDFIDIKATTANPKLSAFIANNICRTFLDFYNSRKQQASAASLDTLRNMADARKQILESKLKLLPAGSNLAFSNSMSMLGNLQTQLTSQKNDLIKSKIALESVNTQISAATKQGGLANNEEIIALRNSLDNLTAQYTQGGSQDAALADKINKVRAQLQQKLSISGDNPAGVSLNDLMKQRSDLNLQIQIDNQTIEDLQTKINELNGTVASSASQQNVVQGIQNEIDVARQEYTQANDLYNQALNYNSFPGNNFKQTLAAGPALYPDPSKKIKKVAFAGVGVFFGLIFILLFLELTDQSIRVPSGLKENIDLPVLANLKKISMKDMPAEQIFSANGSLPEHKRSYREQIKQLRYEVENSGKKIFLVAGYHEGAGRTTLIQALAGSLSLKNDRILLVDANFHHNTLSQKYQAQAALETLKTGNDAAADKALLLKNLTDTGDAHVKVLGCGRGDYTPEEVLPASNILSYLKHNNPGFDYILIDCAALSQGPDCKELLQYTDSVILLFAADQTLTGEDKKFMDFLKKEKVSVLGAVLNRINEHNLNM
jgi:Mrp family chromosome partitioning ATPase/uncharacterized protein involved in exopolysaccharide biosynthesis